MSYMYDLEERALLFARSVRDLVKALPRNISNVEYSMQLIRSSASIGANYIEANEKLSRKDFAHRMKIAKKEAKETIYWLRLIEPSAQQEALKEDLIDEARQLMSILGSISNKLRLK